MASRQNYYNESTAESTHTGDTNYTDKVSLIFTPDANSDYYIFGCCAGKHSTVSASFAGFRHYDGSAAVTENANFLPVSTGDYLLFSSVAKFSYGASPAQQTHKIQYKTGGSANTAGIKYARLWALKKGANDQENEDTSQSTTTNGAYQDKLTLTFTPGTQGDYIIIASAILGLGNAGDNVAAQLDVDGTGFGEASFNTGSASGRFSWGVMRKVNLTAASHSIKVQYKRAQGSGAAVNIQQVRIVALRASDFDNVYYGENTSNDNTTSNAFQDDSTLTQTPAALSHIIFACQAHGSNNQNTASAIAQLLEGSTTLVDTSVRGRFTGNQCGINGFHFVRETLAASSTTWKTQYKSGTSGTSIFGNHSSIAVLQLDAAGNVYDNSISLGTTMNVPAPTRNIVFGKSVSLAVSQGVSESRVIDFGKTVSYGATAGYALTPENTTARAISFAASVGLAEDAGNITDRSIALASALGLSNARAVLVPGSISLGAVLDETSARVVAVPGSIALGVTAGESHPVEMITGRSITLAAQMAVALAVGNVTARAIALAAQAGISFSGGQDLASSISFAVTAGVSDVPGVVIGRSLALSITVGIAGARSATISASIALGTVLTYGDLAQAIHEASIALQVQPGFNLQRALIIGKLITLAAVLSEAAAGDVITLADLDVYGRVTITVSPADSVTVTVTPRHTTDITVQ